MNGIWLALFIQLCIKADDLLKAVDQNLTEACLVTGFIFVYSYGVIFASFPGIIAEKAVFLALNQQVMAFN